MTSLSDAAVRWRQGARIGVRVGRPDGMRIALRSSWLRVPKSTATGFVVPDKGNASERRLCQSKLPNRIGSSSFA